MVNVGADAQIQVLLGNACLQLGETENAISSVKNAIERGWSEPASLYMLIALLIKQGRRQETEAYFNQILVQGVKRAMAHHQVAKTLRKLGSRENSVEEYERSIAIVCDDCQTQFEIAVVLQEMGRQSEAANWYEKSLRLCPGNVQAYCNIAICLLKVNQSDRACQILQKANKLHPENAFLLFYLGEAYQNLNNFKRAIPCYRDAIELSSESAALRGSLARALRNIGDTAAAIKELEYALKLDPANATAHHDLGVCIYDDVDFIPAKHAFMNAVQYNPCNDQSIFYLGLTCAHCGDQIEAEKHFGKIESGHSSMECFVDSYRYICSLEHNAKFFSTPESVFQFAISQSGTDGLFMEFGVYNGASINIIATKTANKVYGFDTFQGLPIDWVVKDGDSKTVEPAGSYSTHGSLPEVPANVELIVGVFEETLPGFCKSHSEPVSFINIDCDLYESTKTIFDCLAGQIQHGTIIVFDDYFCIPGWRDHEHKALQDFVGDAGVSYEYLAFNFFTRQVIIRVIVD